MDLARSTKFSRKNLARRVKFLRKRSYPSRQIKKKKDLARLAKFKKKDLTRPAKFLKKDFAYPAKFSKKDLTRPAKFLKKDLANTAEFMKKGPTRPAIFMILLFCDHYHLPTIMMITKEKDREYLKISNRYKKMPENRPPQMPILLLFTLSYKVCLHNLAIWQGIQYPKRRIMVDLQSFYFQSEKVPNYEQEYLYLYILERTLFEVSKKDRQRP